MKSTFEMQRLVAAPIDIEIYDTSVTPEVPYNLTGKSVKLTVKNKSDSTDGDESALIKKVITVHTDALNGLTGFTPDETERSIASGIYKADIKVFDGASLEMQSDIFDFKVIDIVGKTKT